MAHKTCFFFSRLRVFSGLVFDLNKDSPSQNVLWDDVSPISQPFNCDYVVIIVITCQVEIACGEGPTQRMFLIFIYLRMGFS